MADVGLSPLSGPEGTDFCPIEEGQTDKGIRYVFIVGWGRERLQGDQKLMQLQSYTAADHHVTAQMRPSTTPRTLLCFVAKGLHILGLTELPVSTLHLIPDIQQPNTSSDRPHLEKILMYSWNVLAFNEQLALH